MLTFFFLPSETHKKESKTRKSLFQLFRTWFATDQMHSLTFFTFSFSLQLHCWAVFRCVSLRSTLSFSFKSGSAQALCSISLCWGKVNETKIFFFLILRSPAYSSAHFFESSFFLLIYIFFLFCFLFHQLPVFVWFFLFYFFFIRLCVCVFFLNSFFIDLILSNVHLSSSAAPTCTHS